MNLRRWTPAPAVFAATAVVWATSAPPRVVLLNAAFEVQRPWPQPLAWLALGLSLGVAARLTFTGLPRWLCLAAALFAAASALDQAAFRVRLDDEGLAARGLFGTRSLAWTDVTRVDAGSAAIVVWGAAERQVRVGVGSFREDQRATLERAIARRVRAAASRSGAPARE